jgi:hypothetical protein
MKQGSTSTPAVWSDWLTPEFQKDHSESKHRSDANVQMH